MYVVVHIAGN